MAYCFTVLLTFLAIECFLRVPFLSRIQAVTTLVKKVVRMLPSSRISDHWKEKVLLRYALILMVNSLVLFIMLAGGLLLVVGGAFVLDLFVTPDPATLETILSLPGVVIMMGASVVYLYGRNRMREADYNSADRILHRLALGSALIRHISFDIETTMTPVRVEGEGQKHIFICGLARAGTTILMRCFHDSGKLCSLTYRDMPFVLMPNIWKRFSALFRRDQKPQERAHGDGLQVDYNSPEAFEEVFWRTFCGKQYVLDDSLRPHDVDADTVDKFRRYVGSIIHAAGAPSPRYLSKNNNNILRIASIRKAFPNALIIIPFRDPVEQAGSLREQHRQFLALQSEDSFISDYMCWLGHHEFGLTHKPFKFSSGDGLIQQEYQPENVNYWLNIWIQTYQFLIESAPSDALFVCYEELCEDPETALNNLFKQADIVDQSRLIESVKKQPSRSVDGLDAGLVSLAMQVYGKMCALRSS